VKVKKREVFKHFYFTSNVRILVLEVACQRSGMCLGTIIGETFDASDATGCQQKCQNNVDCLWFTFDNSNLECLLYSSCTEINESICSSCVSSYKDCKARGKTFYFCTDKLILYFYFYTYFVCIFRTIFEQPVFDKMKTFLTYIFAYCTYIAIIPQTSLFSFAFPLKSYQN